LNEITGTKKKKLVRVSSKPMILLMSFRCPEEANCFRDLVAIWERRTKKAENT